MVNAIFSAVIKGNYFTIRYDCDKPFKKHALPCDITAGIVHLDDG
jgi:hypothetical protein